MAREWEDDDEAGEVDEPIDELPDESDQDPPGEESLEATEECPHCGAEIYPGDWCPKCGKYLSREDAPANRPTWVIVTALVCLLMVLLWMLW